MVCQTNSLLSFPKIMSARNDDVARTEWAWRQWIHVAEPLDLTEHPWPTINACAIHYNRKNTRSESAASVARRKQAFDPSSHAEGFRSGVQRRDSATAISVIPKGRARWTLRLLENKVVELGIVDRASDSTIGRALKKTLFSPIAASTGSSRRRPTARS